MKHPPIILVGTHRSGTTWLGEAFSQASDVAYWPEPRHVWTYRNWFRNDDVLTETDVSPTIKAYIRRRFDGYVRRKSASRFCEKTPSNCLRLRFIQEIFPEARIVVILRDGRAVIRSTREIIARGGARWKRMLERIVESRPVEWPAFLEKSPLVLQKLLRRKDYLWGARPPGWQEWGDLDADTFFAKQWAATLDRALDDFDSLNHDQRLMVKYEQLVNDAPNVLNALLEFSQVQDIDSVRQFIDSTRNPQRADHWRESFSVDELERLRPHLEPTLQRINYEW